MRGAARSLIALGAGLLGVPAVAARGADLGAAKKPAGVVVTALPAAPAAAAALPAVDDPLTVQVLTFGPGDHPFTRFGHDAIRVVDRRAHTDTVYNFGTFSMDAPGMVTDFLRGRLRYWLSRSSMASTLAGYRADNRLIEAQDLDLLLDEKRELTDRLEVNARPENSAYRYDYFHDNCSTRVRDALDGVLRGRLRAAAAGPGAMTLRDHALRMAADNLPLYLGLLIVLGPSTDRPISQWTEDFLPQMLARNLREVRVGEPGAGSGARPLVKGESVLFGAARPAPRAEEPHWLPFFLAVGLAAGLVLFGLGQLGARVAAVRFLFGVVVAALGLGLGGVGCFLVGAWFFTPHAVVYRNENALLFAPFALALAGFGLGTAFGRPGATRKLYLTAAGGLGLALTACLLKLFPWSRQENGALILLLLPSWLGLFFGARALAVAVVERGAARV